ncbi:hypothetical protein CYMTET_46948 [Cymbomonas tetramitiformis]|uniref:Uncharacterized protein n=1 Tax=Cymbomonas tetramitiformis TaxID=36881 RepID=A0AAE0BX30_9CHLO|nr:hypothetical protein CYMTET_46948 [Cymbomonas tetramitiformis]
MAFLHSQLLLVVLLYCSGSLISVASEDLLALSGSMRSSYNTVLDAVYHKLTPHGRRLSESYSKMTCNKGDNTLFLEMFDSPSCSGTATSSTKVSLQSAWTDSDDANEPSNFGDCAIDGANSHKYECEDNIWVSQFYSSNTNCEGSTYVEMRHFGDCKIAQSDASFVFVGSAPVILLALSVSAMFLG